MTQMAYLPCFQLYQQQILQGGVYSILQNGGTIKIMAHIPSRHVSQEYTADADFYCKLVSYMLKCIRIVCGI